MAEHGIMPVSGSDEDNRENGATLSTGMMTVKPQTRLGDKEEVCLDEELLPDIPNDVTIDVISAKLSWSDFTALSRVSPGWKKAFAGRLLYNARVRTGSTETLAIVVHKPSQQNARKISLYSMREDSWYKLPPIPGLRFGMPRSCQCVSLDGRVYVLGGEEICIGGCGYRPGRNVYVWDLAGDGHWKQCASMLYPRANYDICQAGVIDGKIFVFGGTNKQETVLESEVYDPKVDSWSRIKPMISPRSDYQVTTMEKEFVVHGGLVYGDHRGARFSLNWEAYCPIKEEWRLVEAPEQQFWEALFVAEGKIHSITELGIYVLDLEKHSRTLFQPCLFPESGRPGSRTLPRAATHMDGELLILLDLAYSAGGSRFMQRTFLRSSGFGLKNKEIIWKRIQCPCLREVCLGCHTNFLMGSIQL